MKFIFFFILIFCFTTNIFSQSNITGHVIDKEINQPLSNATVTLKCDGTITQTNELGHFILKNYCKKDTIQISMIGYKKQVISLDTFKGVVALFPDITQLSEVRITTKKSKMELDSYSGIHLYTYGTSSPMFIAQKIYNKRIGATLSAISLRKTGDYATFKIHIYNIDTTTQKPNTDLTDTGILVESSNRNFEINLEPYSIMLNQPVFFVGIEWISTPKNNSYSFSKRTKSYAVSEIQPYLYMKLKKEKEELNETSIFMKFNKKNRWESDHIGLERKFLISATIKY